MVENSFITVITVVIKCRQRMSLHWVEFSHLISLRQFILYCYLKFYY